MTHDRSSSTVYAIIPAAIMSCLSILRSPRGSYGILPLMLRSRAAAGAEQDPTVLVGEERDQVYLEEETTIKQDRILSSMLQRRKHGGPSSQQDVSTLAPKEPESITHRSGVRWIFAEQGRSLYKSASAQRENTSFSRRAYVDGVAYLLRGLPEDLDAHENAVIREALPVSVKAGDPMNQGGKTGDGPRQSYLNFILWCAAGCVNLAGKAVHHGTGLLSLLNVALVIVHMFLSFLIDMINLATGYEKKYQLSQKILGLTDSITQETETMKVAA
ncbi:hypothetical protein F5Y16DRAFT_399703 [Xylariaceae sp. FL0255]|nr:hypothetical protein F5Y16DRAFT_399703 [Xylariaceae sp. FL0255]